MQHNNLDHIKKAFKDTDLILIIDKYGKILYYNNYNDIHNKLGTEDVVGKTLMEVYPWLTEEASTALEVLKTGEAIINKPQVMGFHDGTSVNAINTAFPLKNKDGIVGVVFLSNDINSIATPEVPRTKRLKKQNLGARYTFDDIITQSEGVLWIIGKLKKVSKHNSNILVYGETGTGKELFVHAIHNESNRSHMPFISQNCAAIPESLMESLIFGTTAGSFTGSIDKKGLFELANGGTIFLDEINSMPLSLQSKLLRVIEDKKVRRIGGNTEFEVDVRIIASTNEAPEYLLENNKFRKDLFYRLSVVNVELPALRERKDDIEYLCQYFINEFNAIFGADVGGIDPQVKKIFLQYNWPGNIRELKNCLEGAFNSVDGKTIITQDIPTYISKINKSSIHNNIIDLQTNNGMLLENNYQSLEKHLILEALENTGNNISKASKLLGVPRQTIYNKLKKYNINIRK